MFSRTILIGMLGVLVLPAPTRAQDTQPAAADPLNAGLATSADAPATGEPKPPLRLHLTAGAWLPRLGGSVGLGPSSFGDIEIETQFDLDDQETTLNGELLLTGLGGLGVWASGFDFSTDQETQFVGNGQFGSLTLNNGDDFRASFDMLSIGGEVLIPLKHPIPGPDGQWNERDAAFGFDILLGVRYLDVDQEVELLNAPGGRERAGGDWIIPYAGVRMILQYKPGGSLRLIKHFEIDAAGAAGTSIDGDGGLSWQVRAGMSFYLTENVAFLFGYRLQDFDVENGDYRFDGGLQGLYLAGTLRF